MTWIDYMLWIYHGGGQKLYDEVYGQYGCKWILQNFTPIEAGFRTHKPIRTLEEYKGLRKEPIAGSICAGGTLGILIPPSIMLVLMGSYAGVPVGQLFMGALVPGAILSGLYVCYIMVTAMVLFIVVGATSQIDMIQIYREMVPFIILMLSALAVCIIFPQTVLYLPGLMN